VESILCEISSKDSSKIESNVLHYDLSRVSSMKKTYSNRFELSATKTLVEHSFVSTWIIYALTHLYKFVGYLIRISSAEGRKLTVGMILSNEKT